MVDKKVHNFNMALIRSKKKCCPIVFLSDNRMTSYNYRACVHPLEGVTVYSTILLHCTIDNIGPFHFKLYTSSPPPPPPPPLKTVVQGKKKIWLHIVISRLCTKWNGHCYQRPPKPHPLINMLMSSIVYPKHWC